MQVLSLAMVGVLESCRLLTDSRWISLPATAALRKSPFCMSAPELSSDHEIERKTGVKIPLIFELEGVDGFRKRETAALEELCQLENIVMATGGGAILLPENRELLKNNGKVVNDYDKAIEETKNKSNEIEEFASLVPPKIDKTKTEKSIARLKYFYFNKGFFDVKATFSFDSIGSKKAKVKYAITPGKPYFIDSLKTSITTPALDSLYKSVKGASFVQTGKQYKTEDFENERNRITTHFRNNGVYHFQPNDVTFDIDTINKHNKANIDLAIGDYSYQEQDSTRTTPFKIYKISKVNVFTDYSASDADAKITDSISYKNFNLYSKKKLKYKPYAITDAIFITKGGLFSDAKTTLTSRYLSNLKVFNYPSILYEIDKKDSTNQ